MDALRAIAECLDLRATTVQYATVPESKRETIFVTERGDKEVVDDVINTIITAEKGGPLLRSQLKDIIGAGGWKETVAKAILFNLEQMIQKGPNTLARALQEAIQVADEAVKDVFQFAADHQCVHSDCDGSSCHVGPMADRSARVWGPRPLLKAYLKVSHYFTPMSHLKISSFAACWQSTYEGYVPSGSLFSFFQRLGMVWH